MFEQDRHAEDCGHRPAFTRAARPSGFFGHLPEHRQPLDPMADDHPHLQHHHEGRILALAHRQLHRPLQALPARRQPGPALGVGPLRDVQELPVRAAARDASPLSLRPSLSLPQQPPLLIQQRQPLKDLPPLVHRNPRVLAPPGLRPAVHRPLHQPLPQKYVQKDRNIGVYS